MKIHFYEFAMLVLGYLVDQVTFYLRLVGGHVTCPIDDEKQFLHCLHNILMQLLVQFQRLLLGYAFIHIHANFSLMVKLWARRNKHLAGYRSRFFR
jgi:hypothetical protein